MVTKGVWVAFSFYLSSSICLLTAADDDVRTRGGIYIAYFAGGALFGCVHDTHWLAGVAKVLRLPAVQVCRKTLTVKNKNRCCGT